MNKRHFLLLFSLVVILAVVFAFPPWNDRGGFRDFAGSESLDGQSGLVPAREVPVSEARVSASQGFVFSDMNGQDLRGLQVHEIVGSEVVPWTSDLVSSGRLELVKEERDRVFVIHSLDCHPTLVRWAFVDLPTVAIRVPRNAGITLVFEDEVGARVPGIRVEMKPEGSLVRMQNARRGLDRWMRALGRGDTRRLGQGSDMAADPAMPDVARLLELFEMEGGSIWSLFTFERTAVSDQEGVARFVGLPAQGFRWRWQPGRSGFKVLCSPQIPDPTDLSKGVPASFTAINRVQSSAPFALQPGENRRFLSLVLRATGLRGSFQPQDQLAKVVIRVRHVTRIKQCVGRDQEAVPEVEPTGEFEILGLVPGEKVVSISAQNADGDLWQHAEFVQVVQGEVLDMGDVFRNLEDSATLYWKPEVVTQEGVQLSSPARTRGKLNLIERVRGPLLWETIFLEDVLRPRAIRGLPFGKVRLQVELRGGGRVFERDNTRTFLSVVDLAAGSASLSPRILVTGQ